MKLCRYSSILLAMKFMPLSEMSMYGTPYQAMMLFLMNLSIAVAVTILNETASTHLVK